MCIFARGRFIRSIGRLKSRSHDVKIQLTNWLTDWMEAGMHITYANAKVEKYFLDYRKMQSVLPLDWVRAIKKYMDWFKAAENFAVILDLRLGRPERLTGYNGIRYSFRVSAQARLIMEPQADQESLLACTEAEVEGVCDYHGSKENWYIP